MRGLVMAALLAAPLQAADPQVYRLTPAEREAAIASASNRPEREALLPLPDPDPATAGQPPSSARDATLGNSLYGTDRTDRRVHGEVGIFVGSGGARGIFGSAGVPLGENGAASLSFGTGRFPGYGYNRGFGYGPGGPPAW